MLLATASELTHLLGPRRLPLRVGRPATTRSCRSSSATAQVRWGPTLWDAARWGLPTDGAVIPVWSHGVRRGRFVLTAPVGLPMSTHQLAKAVALVDQAGASLAVTGAA